MNDTNKQTVELPLEEYIELREKEKRFDMVACYLENIYDKLRGLEDYILRVENRGAEQ